MNWFKSLIGVGMVGVSLLALWPEPAQAQRGGGGGGGGRGGAGWGGGVGNYGSRNFSYGNYGGRAGGFGFGFPGSYGYGNNYGYGRSYGGYYPGYSPYYQAPSYGYNSYYPSTSYYPSQTYSQPAAVNAATLEVRVPDANATVTVEGQPMAQDGFVRTFQTSSLETGYNYSYQIQCLTPGAPAQQRTVTFRAGERVVVDFTRSNSTPPAAP